MQPLHAHLQLLLRIPQPVSLRYHRHSSLRHTYREEQFSHSGSFFPHLVASISYNNAVNEFEGRGRASPYYYNNRNYDSYSYYNNRNYNGRRGGVRNNYRNRNNYGGRDRDIFYR
jgi:hypothetical protein